MKNHLDFYCFVISLRLFIFEEWCKHTFKKYRTLISKRTIFCWHLEGHWRKEQDPRASCTNPRDQIGTKMSRIHNTVLNT